MKKFMRTALILVLAVLCLGTTALAADSSVTYSGNSGKFIFAPGSDKSPTDLFDEFKLVMPGATLTEEILVKNKANNKVDVKIYIRAKGANDGSEKFLNQLGLKVMNHSDSDKVLFDAKADETAQLTEWQPLGTFKSGSEATLLVELTVPADMGNDYQTKTGELVWEFRAEEFPVNTPDTGDETPLALYGAIAAVCAAGIVLLLVTKKKRTDNA